jgi:hypothetical protein
MRVTRKKLIAVGGAGTLALLGAGAFLAGEVLWLVGVTFLAVLASAVASLALAAQTQRRVDLRLRTLEAQLVTGVRQQLADEAFVQNLRGLALPQAHADQLIRTLEASNARIETAIDQLRAETSGRTPPASAALSTPDQ